MIDKEHEQNDIISTIKSRTKIKVRYAETDAMGIVHHANYYVYFENAREDLVALCGLTYQEIEEKGIMMPIAETQCKYYSPAKYADELLIETTIEKFTPIQLVTNYRVTNEKSGTLIAVGKTVQGFVDKVTFKLTNLKKHDLSLWNKMNYINE